MSAHEIRLSRWLAAHHGVVTRTWLVANGYSPGRIRFMLESGRLVEVHRGVYRARSAAPTNQQRMVGLVMMSGGVISHGSAGPAVGLSEAGLDPTDSHHHSRWPAPPPRQHCRAYFQPTARRGRRSSG